MFWHFLIIACTGVCPPSGPSEAEKFSSLRNALSSPREFAILSEKREVSPFLSSEKRSPGSFVSASDFSPHREEGRNLDLGGLVAPLPLLYRGEALSGILSFVFSRENFPLSRKNIKVRAPPLKQVQEVFGIRGEMAWYVPEKARIRLELYGSNWPNFRIMGRSIPKNTVPPVAQARDSLSLAPVEANIGVSELDFLSYVSYQSPYMPYVSCVRREKTTAFLNVSSEKGLEYPEMRHNTYKAGQKEGFVYAFFDLLPLPLLALALNAT